MADGLPTLEGLRRFNAIEVARMACRSRLIQKRTTGSARLYSAVCKLTQLLYDWEFYRDRSGNYE